LFGVALKILLEMRPALDGHAGIPQEARLLFRGLSLLDDVTVEGLIQSSGRILAEGLPTKPGFFSRSLTEDQRINRLSRVVISLQQSPNPRPKFYEKIGESLDYAAASGALILSNLFGGHQELSRFETAHFRDFIWRALFAKTLPFEDFEVVTKANFRVASTPWTVMQTCALATKKFGVAIYPRLNTSDFDVMVAETPYPGTVSPRTKLVVRYHDAIPLLMPHTISDKAYHQASHYNALRKNVESGAYFACVSDATRRDLISIFPQAEARAVTIHNMISHHYFDDDSTPIRIPEIIRTRQNASIEIKRTTAISVVGKSAAVPPVAELAVAQHESITDEEDHATAASEALDYLLIVSTIEPRKNHLTLLSAWEQMRTEGFPKLKLVIVGMLGWDHAPIVKKFRPWLERGEVFMLEDVPAPELRLLYKHARATICPSYGEGFDFSGVEAMRCGGAVAASDIPVHRDVYSDAAEYFTPYSAPDIAAAIARVVDPVAASRRAELVRKGATISAQYMPEKILPRWQEFLTGLKTSAIDNT
jgi:glycosyltransferase involved in cell wall biosynthesis